MKEINIRATERLGSIKRQETDIEKCLRATMEILIAQENKSTAVFIEDKEHKALSWKFSMNSAMEVRSFRARAEHSAVLELPTKRALGIEKKQAQRNLISEWEGKIRTNKN